MAGVELRAGLRCFGVAGLAEIQGPARNRKSALESAWPYSDATLRLTAERSKDVEASVKARTIRERCWDRCVDNAPWADFPLWDSELKQWNASRLPFLNRAINRDLPYAAGHPWENYRQVSRQWALSSLRKGWTTPTIVRLWFQCGRAIDADYERVMRGEGK